MSEISAPVAVPASCLEITTMAKTGSQMSEFSALDRVPFYLETTTVARIGLQISYLFEFLP